MERKILSDVKEITFWKLLTDKNVFLIPNYQRPYAWEKEKQVKDFWEDIYTSFKNNPLQSYLLGNIYLAPINSFTELKRYIQEEIFKAFFADIGKNEKVKNLEDLKEDWERVNFYLLIDGQQRTTTFFLLIKALKESLKKDLGRVKLSVKLDELKELPKLIMGSINAQFFQNIIFDGFDGSISEIGNLSNKRLYETLNYLRKKVNSLDKKEKKEFANYIINHVNIIQSIISSLSHAVILFISQTDRGKELTYLEKLKSLLSFYIYTKPLNKDDKTNILNKLDKIFGESFNLLDSLIENNIFSREKEVEDYYFKIIRIIEAVNKDKDLKKARRISPEEAYEKIKISLREKDVKELKKYIKEVLGTINEINQLFTYIIENLHIYNFTSIFKLLKPSPQTYAFLTKLHAKFPNLKFEEKKFSWERDYESLSEYFNEEKQKLKEKIKNNLKDNNAKQFLLDKLKKIKFKKNETPISILNLIELLELAVWKAGKEPIQKFKNAWKKALNSNSEEGIVNAFEFLEEYRFEYLDNYTHFTYIYSEYEHEKYQNDIINKNLFGELSIEHIFPREKITEISKYLCNFGFEDEKEYDKFVGENPGNWILIEKKLNSKLKNMSPIDKGFIYAEADSKIRSIKSLGENLKHLSNLTNNKPSSAFKYLLEIRYLELTSFLYYRFI